MPPKSGSFRNPYSDWIGAQMRGMVCGMLAPGWPLEAARLAYIDGTVSHARNGIYGGMYAAVLTALAYVRSDERALLEEALNYVPPGSEYAAVAREILAVLRSEPNPAAAWRILDARFEEYNWIHAYPNLAADMLALWHARGDLTTAFRWLAHAGLDVDCNAGLVGTVLGVMYGAPEHMGRAAGRSAGDLPARQGAAVDPRTGGAHGTSGTSVGTVKRPSSLATQDRGAQRSRSPRRRRQATMQIEPQYLPDQSCR